MQIFPTLVGAAFPVKKRPGFDTIIQKAGSGVEVRIGNYIYPIWEWDLPFSWLSQEAAYSDYQTLVGLYVSLSGPAGTFLFSDPTDNTTGGVPALIATGDGSTTTFQIGRTLGAAFEPIWDINSLSAAPKIYLNTTLQSSGYTINSTGLITFATAPTLGTQVKADFQYYWRCRFVEDLPEFVNFVNLWWEANLKIQQVKVT
jgi:uncharacterized protein (TIGR02217 family)